MRKVKSLKFELSGKTGFFKKPDVNVNTYFTYNNIHKVALLGILGAIIGLPGHIQQNRDKIKGNSKHIEYPEFYYKLKNLKLCIKPLGNRGYFSKKVQVFNNSVGYASKETGGNLIVREQWLENPKWEIYLLDDGSIEKLVFEKLQDYLLNNKCVYMPYLGKNDHPANIKNCEVVMLEEVKKVEHIDSLFIINNVEFGRGAYSEDEEMYLFREFSPISLSEKYNFYEFEELCYTNIFIKMVINKNNFYKQKEEILAFF